MTKKTLIEIFVFSVEKVTAKEASKRWKTHKTEG